MSSLIKQDNSLEFSQDQIQTLKNTICKGVSDEEFKVFLHACQRTGLDPFMKQIYAVKRGNALTIQTGIDGFRLIAERTGRYAPGKETTFVYLGNETKIPFSATAFIKKMTPDGTWHEYSATVFWEEYVQSYNGKPSNFWAKMPHVMLSKVAESVALRKGFPAELSGVYSEEEMQQADHSTITQEKELMSETILISQCSELMRLVEDNEKLKNKILDHYSIRSLEDLKKKDFIDCLERIHNSIRTMKDKMKEVNYEAV